MAQSGKLKKNLLYNISYQILVIILPLITAPYVSRVLGSHNVGVYSYTQAFANYFYLFTMLGVNNYGNRTIAAVRDDQYKLSKTFWEIFSFQFILGLIISSGYLIYCLCFIKTDKIIYLMQFFYVVSGVFDVNWLCFGLEKFKFTTMRSTIIRIGMAVCTFAFVKNQNDLAIYTLILAGGNLLAVLAIWPFIKKHVDFVKPTIKGILLHLKPNLLLFWPVIAVSLYNIMDKLMLGAMSTKEEVGFYTYAERITQIPNTLILALDSVIMPRMSNLLAKKESDTAVFLMDNVMMFAMLMAAVMSFGLAAVGPTFAPWFYGAEFSRCGLFIVMLSPIIIFKGWAGALRTQYIIPAKKDRIYIISLTSGAIINLIINFILIPKIEGIGAVIGTIVAELTVCFIQFFMVRKEVHVTEYIKNGVSFCLIGFIMYVVISKIRTVFDIPIAIMGAQVILGGIIYMLLAALFMIKIKKNPTLVNEVLKLLHINKKFEMR